MSELFAIWVIGIGATVVTVVLMWLIYFVYKAKLLEREERRLMIERGMTPPTVEPNRGWPGVKARELELKAEERRLRIEKGLDVAPESPSSPPETLRRGLVWGAIGLGLAGAYIVFKTSGVNVSDETRNWFLFFGVISPAATLYGVANVVHYELTKNRR